eukprot:GHVU01039382.1.p1 GENE.GHVU01039382.1~~GHVU01039382.1.p1  ORF type:complete len:263 (-),score=62.57 GHVU01039382.1:253-1041(-)
MPAGQGVTGAKVKKSGKNRHPLIESTPKQLRIGGTVVPKTDLSRYVRWPKYVLMQRQKRVLLTRLKVPPALNQFSAAINKNQTQQLMRLLGKYKPEDKGQKKKRLLEEAERRKAGQEIKSGKPVVLKFGFNHVVDLIEARKAKLVVIANDVEPVELVCWLPALCRKKDIPYCIVKGRSRLGRLVHLKNAACLCVETVKKEDQAEFDLLCKNFRAEFNDNIDLRRRWGGGVMGIKSQHMEARKLKAVEIEAAKKRQGQLILGE